MPRLAGLGDGVVSDALKGVVFTSVGWRDGWVWEGKRVG